MPKVIIHDAIDEAGVDLLKSRADLEICEVARDDDETLHREIADADGLILRYLPLRAAALEAATRLKVVARHGVGCDNVDVDAATARKIPVATVGDANAVAVAELTLFFMLAASKRARHYDEAVRRGDFLARETADHLELYGRTVLLLGFGRIAQKVAARCRAFEMTVECFDPYVPQQDIVDAGCTPVADLAEALPRADYVSVHVPLNDETRHLIDKEALARMKQGAILVNAARGSIVDGRALYEALESGHLAGAGPRRLRRRTAATRRSVAQPSGCRAHAAHGWLHPRRLHPHGDPVRAARARRARRQARFFLCNQPRSPRLRTSPGGAIGPSIAAARLPPGKWGVGARVICVVIGARHEAARNRELG